METLNPFFEWLLKTSFQASLLIGLILLLQIFLRSRLPVRWRYSLWLVLLIRLALPWAPQSSVSLFNLLPRDVGSLVAPLSAEPSANVDADRESVRGDFALSDIFDTTKDTAAINDSKSIPVSDKHTMPQKLPESYISAHLQWTQLLSLVWFAGAAVLAVYVLATNFRLWRIVKARRPLTEKKILDLLEDCKAQMGVQTILGIVQTDSIKSPALFGFIRPRLLLPEGLIDSVNPAELRYIFLHELGHLRRYDILQGWLMAALQVLHWFNPLIWLAFYHIRTDRELVCDALAMGTMKSDEPPQYGRTIVNLLERFSRTQYLPSMAGILENKAHLKRRITMIAKFQKSTKKATVAAVILTLALGCLVLTNAQAKSQPKNNNPELLAEEFVELLVSGKFTTATKNFDATMKTALPAKKLKEAWNSTISQAGPFKRQMGARAEKLFSSVAVIVTCEFGKGPLDVKVVYNDKQKVSGLWFLSTPQNVLQRYQKPDSELSIPDLETPIPSHIDSRGHKVDKIDYPFVNDPDVIGTWKSVDLIENIGDFNPDVKQWKGGELYLKKLVIQPGGRTAKSWWTWTKGLVLHSGDKTASRYIIKELNGSTYMFFEWKSGDYTIRHRKPNYYVLKREKGIVRTKIPRPTRTKARTRPSQPRVISTEPVAFDNNVSPSLKKITVTFDQEMMDGSWSWTGGGDTYPERAGKIFYDHGKKTCTMPVKLEPGRVYWVGINSPSHKNFKAPRRVPAQRYVILFATTDKNGKPTPIPENYLARARQINLHMPVTRVPVKKSLLEDLQINPQIYIVAFRAVPPFAPRTPKELLDAFNKNHPKGVRTHHFRTTIEGGELVGLICVDGQDGADQVKGTLRRQNDRLVFINSTRATPEKLQILYNVVNESPGRTVEGGIADSGKDSQPLELARDDGITAGRNSIAGSGHAVRFEAPGKDGFLTAVKIFGSRYGSDRPPQEDFNIWLCDDNFHVLSGFNFPYSKFTKGPPRWVTLKVKPVKLPSRFILCVGFNPERTKGVYVHSDKQNSGNSFIGLPDIGQKLKPYQKGDWKIRAMISIDKKEEITEAEKKAAELLSSKAWRLWQERKLPQAEDMFKKAVDKDPTNSNAWNGLGWSQLNQGMQFNAKEAFEKCLKIEPKHAAALNGLGWIAKGQGKTDEAISHWEKSVKAVPTATAALSGLTQTWMGLKQYDKAVKYYQMWLKVEPDNADAKTGMKKAKAGLEK